MLNTALVFESSPQAMELLLEAFFKVQPDKHVQAFRLYWHMRGIDVKTNGQRFDLRGKPVAMGKSLDQAAREYGR